MNEAPSLILPWDKFSVEIPKDASVKTILKKSGFEWEVEKTPVQIYRDVIIPDKFALVKKENTDAPVFFDLVGPQYQPIQNETAVEWFHEICSESNSHIHTAGSFNGGQRIWLLARTPNYFDIDGKDRVRAHLMMTHTHIYGKSTSLFLVIMRESTCATHLVPINFRLTHWTKKEIPGLAEQAGFDAKKLFKQLEPVIKGMVDVPVSEDFMIKYFTKVFYPKHQPNGYVPENVTRVVNSFRSSGKDQNLWEAFQAVCHFIDFQMGKDRGYSLEASWFGPRAVIKDRAFELAATGEL